MLESLYKAKRIRNDEWVFGWYCQVSFGSELEPSIIQKRTGVWGPVQVKRETLCQFVGRKDVDGNKVFERDIVLCYGGEQRFGQYEYSEVIVIQSINDPECMRKLMESEYVKVVGNVYDNIND